MLLTAAPCRGIEADVVGKGMLPRRNVPGALPFTSLPGLATLRALLLTVHRHG